MACTCRPTLYDFTGGRSLVGRACLQHHYYSKAEKLMNNNTITIRQMFNLQVLLYLVKFFYTTDSINHVHYFI